MRVAFRVLLLLLAAAAAGVYGWDVRLEFRDPEPPAPIPLATTEAAWEWGRELMAERGYSPAGEPASRAVRMSPSPMEIWWGTGNPPWVTAHWRGDEERIELPPVQLTPGECFGWLGRSTGDFEPPSMQLLLEGRRAISAERPGLVSVLQLCLPPDTEPHTFDVRLSVSPLAHGDFTTEGRVEWATFRGRMNEGDRLQLVGSPTFQLKGLLAAYAERRPAQQAQADGMVAARAAEVSEEQVLLVPHTLANYLKLLGRFESAYPGKVPHPALVEPSQGQTPAPSPEAGPIRAHVEKHTVFTDGSRVSPHASLIDGRILAVLDLEALGGCARVVLHREGNRQIPSMAVRVDEREPVELNVDHRDIVVHDLCPERGLARFVTHGRDDATYAVSVYVPRGSGGAEPGARPATE